MIKELKVKFRFRGLGGWDGRAHSYFLIIIKTLAFVLNSGVEGAYFIIKNK